MIAYIIGGSGFGGCVDYVTRRKLEEKLQKEQSRGLKADEKKYESNRGEDIIDHLSKDWELIGASSDIRLYEGRKAMADDIARPTRTRKPIESPVGHISLDFHPKDAPKMTNERMADIACDYMKRMGLGNTPYIIVRHFDKAHPHCHLVFSRVDYDGKIITQTTNFKKNERVCKALNLKHRLMQGRSKLDTDVSKLRGKEKVRYKLTHDLARLFVSPDVKDWDSFLIVLLRNGISTKEKVGKSGRMNLYYCVGKQSFWSMKLDPFLTRENLERVFRERMERRLKESESVIKRAERHTVEEPKPEKKVTSQPRVPDQSQNPIHSHKPIVIPPLPFEFLWDVPQSDEAAYRRGETVYTFARKPADRYKAHYWIWYDFKTGKPQCSFDPPKSRDIPQAFLRQVLSSGKSTSISSPQSESSDFRMSHVSLNNAPSDDSICIAHGEPVSGDFKQFLENHPDMDFYDAKRKFKEEQKAKHRVRQGPKIH